MERNRSPQPAAASLAREPTVTDRRVGPSTFYTRHSGGSPPPWKREQLRYPGLGCERRGATTRQRTSTRNPGQGGGVKGEMERAELASCSAWTIPALLHWT